MSTSIDVERVTAVLLDDGWHYIQPASFHIEDYGFTSADDVVAAAQAGYFFTKIDQISRELQYFVGPIGEIRSVRYSVATEVIGGDDDDEDDDEEEF